VIYDAGDSTIVIESMKSSSGNGTPTFSLVTSHGRVLACIAADPEGRLRDIAHSVGITERTAAHIVRDLERAGYLTRSRAGRRNRYEVDGATKVRTRTHTLTIAQLLALLLQALERPLG
jgi:DNA-binding MarR family transcriptional regulator